MFRRKARATPIFWFPQPTRTLPVIMAGAKVGYEGWWIYYTVSFIGSAAATLIAVYIFGVYGDTAPAAEVASRNSKVVEAKASKAAGEVEETETTGY
jgi:hypothetical protein